MKRISNFYSDILLLSIILVTFFLCFISNMPLHSPDEARYSLVSFEMFQTHQYLVPKLFGVAFLDKPPLFYYAQVLMLKLFGYSEFSLRLPSVIAASITCLVVYITGRLVFNRRAGWYGALICANMPLFFIMAHYANLDMMVACFVTLSMCLFVLAQQPNAQHTRLLMWLTYLSMALAMLSKGLIALVLPIGSAVIFFVMQKIKPASLNGQFQNKLYLLDGLIIFAVCVAPWFLMMHQEVPGFSYYYFVIQHFYRYLSESMNNQQPFWFYFAIVFACLLPWVFVVLFKNQRPKNAATIFISIAFIFILLFFSIPTSKTLGYIIPVFPFAALLIAERLSANCGKRINEAFLVLSLLSIVSGLLACYPWLALRAYHHEILPFAFILIFSGCAGLLIKLVFAHPIPSAELMLKQKQLFIALVITTMMALNLTSLKLVQSLEFPSVRPIAKFLERNNPKHLPVVMYYQMYYDLPHYAPHQHIMAVDEWKQGLFKGDSLAEQFALGMAYHASTDFINQAKFSHRWQDLNQKFFILTDKNNADALAAKGATIVAQFRGAYLLYRAG